MTLDRGVVESSTGSSSFFGLRFWPELFNGSIGVDLFFFDHSTTQTFPDKNSSLSSTKDFLGTYMNVYLSYDFLPKAGGEMTLGSILCWRAIFWQYEAGKVR